MNWRTKTKLNLQKMGEFITIHPKKTILFMLLLSILVISNITKITIDTSTEGFLHKEDPALVRYEKFKEQFGQDEKVMVIVESKDIFNVKTLKKLQQLHTELENNVPHLNDITSLMNARNTRGQGDRLIVEDLFTEFPKNQEEVTKLKNIALNNAMYRNLFYNESLTLTTIILEPSAYETSTDTDELAGFSDEITEEELEFLSDSSKSELVRAAGSIAKQFSSDDFNVFIADRKSVV